MNFIHISESNLDGVTLEPRIPDNYFTRNGYEENKTPRVCFAPNIDNALLAIGNNLKGKELYVHVPESKVRKYRKAKPTDVPDAKYSKEIWVLEHVKIKYVGKIKVIDYKGEGLPFQYGDEFTEYATKWDWKWVERPKYNKVFDLSMDIIRGN